LGCYSWHVPSYWEQQSSGSARHKGIVGVNTTICCAPASLWSVLPEYLLFCASAATEISSHLPMERTCPLISTGDDNSLACWQPMCVCVSCGAAGEPLFHTHMAVIGHQLHSPLSPWLSLYCAESCHHIIIRVDLAECLFSSSEWLCFRVLCISAVRGSKWSAWHGRWYAGVDTILKVAAVQIYWDTWPLIIQVPKFWKHPLVSPSWEKSQL